LEIELKLIIENVTFAAFCGELNDITKSLSVIFQSEGYDILNPSIGFSTIKNGFASVIVGVIAVDIDILKLTNKDNNNNDNRTTVNSRCLIRWDVFCLHARDYNNIYRVSMLSDSHNPERNKIIINKKTHKRQIYPIQQDYIIFQSVA